MRRRREQDRRTRNARPSGGYATATLIRSRNATLRSNQYIRAIRSFLVVSNLGCEGVNRRCIRDTRKKSLACRRSIKNVGKQALEQSGKYPVNENDEEISARAVFFAASFRGDAKHRIRNLAIPRCAIVHLRSGPSDHPGVTIFEARWNLRLAGDGLAERGLRRSEPGDRHAIGRARDVVQSDLVAERD